VVIVGYSDAGGYWIVRNSWGAAWDDDGYFNVGYGECLIEDHVYYAQVQLPLAPANDAFAAAETLGPLPATSSQETQFATTQAGEPRPCGSIGATVWYRYTPPAAGTLVADTNGSDYDTVLAVYRGTSLSSLVDVACDDDGGDATRSRVSFSAAAGTTYWFQAGGFYGAKGALRLNLSGPLPPGEPTGLTAAPGDGQVTLDWSAPAAEGTSPITGYVIRYRPSGTLAWATFPDGASTATTSTVTGLANGTRYTFRVAAGNAAGSGPWSAPVRATPRPRRPGAPTGLAASPDDQQVALGWSAPATEGTSPITDYAIQQRQIGALTWTTFRDGPSAATSATVTGLANGVGYEFRVAAKNAVGRGPFSTPAAATPGLGPTNDMFAAATVISGASGQATGTNVGATLEAGEPTHHSQASESVWWQWSAPTSGTVTIDTFGSSFDTVLSVYTGSTVGALTAVAWDDDSGAGLQSQVTFAAAAATTYRIVVDGYAANTGDITLNWLYGVGGPGGAIPI
jgi:hypothetical protein